MLWNICWRLSRRRRRRRGRVRSTRAEAGVGSSRRGECEMAKNEEGRVEALVSELNLDTGTETDMK